VNSSGAVAVEIRTRIFIAVAGTIIEEDEVSVEICSNNSFAEDCGFSVNGVVVAM
jgi:hypothetical protein